MKKNRILLFALFFVLFFSLALLAKRERTLNKDIVISKFKTIVMEQGKDRVAPVFKAKNTGSQTYHSVRILCKSGIGTTNKGQKEYLSVYNYISPKAILKPGQTVTLNPALKESIYIKAKPDQALTTYSVRYVIEYYDRDGRKFTTPTHTIKDFARVVPFNNDIILSHFETVEIEQGMKNVQPLFRIKNRGKQTYSKVILYYKEPEGRAEKGKKVSLHLFDNTWNKVTLKPGQEIEYNPAHRGRYVNLNAAEDQPATIYSTQYWFEFRDSQGYKYRTPPREIKEFVRVKPIERKIVLTGYKTLTVKQGTAGACPLFEIKNTSRRTFKQVKLEYDRPEIVTRNGKNKSYITIEGPHDSEWRGAPGWMYPPEWARVTLKPGQEMILNPGHKDNATLQLHPNQQTGTYSTKYWFEYRDEGGHLYKTPKYEIKEFVKVVPMTEYIELTGFKTIELMQGQGNVTPVLRIKNTGSQPLADVYLFFSSKCFGKDSRGDRDRLMMGDRSEKIEVLEPGEEKQINPVEGDSHPIAISARHDQLMATYRIFYWFQYVATNGSPRKSPIHWIEEFARVGPYNKDIVLTDCKTEIVAERRSNKGPVVVPTFRIKNTGSRIYTDIKIEYDLPDGFEKGTMATHDSVHYDFDRRKGLKPGQEVDVSPVPTALLFRVKLKNPSQKVFSTHYRFIYHDAENRSYKTPKFKIEKFVVLKD